MMDPIIKEDLETILESIPKGVFENKRVLVSGGSGFLGSWICDTLIMARAKVVCLDNLSTGVFENVEHLKARKGFEFVKEDVCTYNVQGRYDMIFHMASRPAPEDYQKHPVETALANSEGTHRMLELARRGDSRLFYASSSEVYGDPEVFPTPESYGGKADPLGPRSCYEEGKRFGETLCKAYHDEYGLDTRLGRIFNSYGPRLRAEGHYGRVVSRFILQSQAGQDLTVFGDGFQTRSFCYVSDTVAGLFLLMEMEGLEGDVINIGSGEETKIIDLANKIITVSQSRSKIAFLPFPAGDHRRRLPDTDKAKKALDWGPTMGLTLGLERTYQWFSNQKRA